MDKGSNTGIATCPDKGQIQTVFKTQGKGQEHGNSTHSI